MDLEFDIWQNSIPIFQIFFPAHTTEHVNYNYNKTRLHERVRAHTRFIHIGIYARANTHSLVTHHDTYTTHASKHPLAGARATHR